MTEKVSSRTFDNVEEEASPTDLVDNLVDVNCDSVKRFACVSKEEVERLKDNSLPVKTQQKVNWAINLFKQWKNENTDESKPLEAMTVSELNDDLQFFIPSLRKKTGEYHTLIIQVSKG